MKQFTPKSVYQSKKLNAHHARVGELRAFQEHFGQVRGLKPRSRKSTQCLFHYLLR